MSDLPQWALDRAREYLVVQWPGIEPRAFVPSLAALLLETRRDTLAEVRRVVEEVGAQAQRDAILIGPAIAGWAIRQIRARLEALK
jgi:hypothetical protein